jgi:hypothetical protein
MMRVRLGHHGAVPASEQPPLQRLRGLYLEGPDVPDDDDTVARLFGLYSSADPARGLDGGDTVQQRLRSLARAVRSVGRRSRRRGSV